MRTRSVPPRSNPSATHLVRRSLAGLLATALTITVFAAALSPVRAAAAPTAATTSATKVAVQTIHAADVSTAHPRLLLNAAGFEAMKTKITTDPTMAAWYRVLKIRADELLTQPTLSNPTPDAMLTTGETLVDRTYTLAFVWRVTGDQRYADRLWKDLAAASAFADWNPDHFLDTSTIAQAFAIGYDWVYAYWTPTQRQQLATAVSGKALTPGVQNYQAGGFWTTTTSNWNVISNSGLGLAALAFADALPGPSDAVLVGVSGSIGYGLSAYGPDGGYEEGLSYWAWATGYLTTFTAALESSTGRDFGILATPGLAKTGRFAVDTSGASGQSFSYGDARANQPLTQALLGLSKLYDDPSLLQRALQGFRWRDADEISARTLVWFAPMTAASQQATVTRPLDSVYRGVGIGSLRGSWTSPAATSVAMRAATTDSASHANLDGGDFTLDALGKQWALESGGTDQYDLAGMLDSKADGGRWNYYRNRPEGQNTLVIGAAGGASITPTATTTLVHSDPDSAAMVADLSSVYRSGGVSWKRGISLFDGRSRVVVQDEVSAASPVDAWWFMHTDADIKVADDGRSAVLTKDGQQLLARIVSGAGPTFARMSAVPLPGSPDPTGQQVPVTRKLAVHVPASAAFTLAVEFTPLIKGVPLAAPRAVTPLAQWSTATPSAQLTGLWVDGQPVTGFAPGTSSYFRGASDRDATPVVTATASQDSTVAIAQTTTVPGSATVRVSRPGADPSVYRIVFSVGALNPTVITATSNQTGATQLVDANTADGWQVTGKQSVTYDFGRPRSVKYVQAFWNFIPEKGALFEFWGSADGQAWTKLYYGSNWIGQNTVTTTLPDPIKAYRFLRFTTLGGGAGDPRTMIGELQAFSNLDPAATSDQPEPAPAMRMTQDQAALEAGTVAPLTWTSTGADGQPSQLPRDKMTFASSNPSVASVDAAGNVTARTAGQARLTAASAVGSDYISASVRLTVTDAKAKSVTATKDAAVVGGDPATKNYGSQTWLQVRSKPAYPTFEQHSYVGFSLAGLDPKTIESARLMVRGWTDDGSTASLDAYAVNGDWSENTITFANRPAMEYRVGGGTKITGTEGWLAIDVSDYVRQRAGQAATIALREDHPANGVSPLMLFRSRETATPPRLDIRLRGSVPAVATPTISSALSSSSKAGRITGTVRAAASTAVTVQVGISSRSQCQPVLADATALPTTTVRTDAAGNGTFSVAGTFAVGVSAVATATVDGRVSPTSACTRVTQDPKAEAQRIVKITEDSYVAGGSAKDTNFGTQNWAQVLAKPQYADFEQLTYYKFDLAGVPAANLSSATLVFTAWSPTKGATADLSAYAVSGAWAERTLTFANKPRFDYRAGTGAKVDDTEAVRTMNVTDYIRQQAGASATLGIRQDNPPTGIGPQIYLRTKESAAPAYLDLRYRAATSSAAVSVAATPKSGSTALSPGTSTARPAFTLAFSAPVLGVPSNGTTKSVALRSGTSTVAAHVSYNAVTRVARVVPDRPLATDVRYDLVATAALKDASGKALPARTWTFTTGPRPKVAATSVAAGRTGVPRTASVAVRFSEAVRGLPTTKAASPRFVLVDVKSKKVVATDVTYTASKRTAVLDPRGRLAAGARYQVALRAGVTDRAGNALLATTWEFTTGRS